jgi:hypothetical protein
MIKYSCDWVVKVDEYNNPQREIEFKPADSGVWVLARDAQFEIDRLKAIIAKMKA